MERCLTLAGQRLPLRTLKPFMMNGAEARGVDSFVILLDRSFVRREDARG